MITKGKFLDAQIMQEIRSIYEKRYNAININMATINEANFDSMYDYVLAAFIVLSKKGYIPINIIIIDQESRIQAANREYNLVIKKHGSDMVLMLQENE